MRTFLTPVAGADARQADPPSGLSGAGTTRLRVARFLRRLISVGPVARSAVVVAGGTAIGQLIVVASSPIVSRLYTPSDLGMLAVYGSLIAMALPVALLRYDLAVQLPRSAREAARLLVAAISIAFTSCALVSILLWVARYPLTRLLGVEALAPYILLVPLGILGASMYLALTAWTVRARRFADLAHTRVTQQLGLCLTQIGSGVLRFGPAGLLLGDVVGRAGGIGALTRAALSHDAEAFRGLSPRRVFVTARRHSRFALLSSAAGLLNTIGLFGPPLLFSSLFGSAIAGQIALGQRVIALPLTLAGQSAAQVYLAEIARLAREMPRAVPALLRRTVQRLALVALVPSVILIVAGPWAFVTVFGGQWRIAGVFAQVLAFSFAAQMVAAPISQTLNMLGRTRLQLGWDFFRTTTVLGGIWMVWRAGGSAFSAVITYSATMIVAYLLLLGMAATAARKVASGAADIPHNSA